MLFPTYIPAAVRDYLHRQLDGEEPDAYNWRAALAKAVQEVAAIQQEMERCALGQDRNRLRDLRRHYQEALARREGLRLEVECLERLASDPRMRDAYAALMLVIATDAQWQGFIASAWVSRRDYGRERERRSRAIDLRERIAANAGQLAGRLRELEALDVDPPGVCTSLPALIRCTEIDDLHDPALQSARTHWRAMRRLILGDTPPQAPEDEVPPSPEAEETIPVFKPVFVTADERSNLPAEQQLRHVLRYAWGKAPDLATHLETLAREVGRWEPEQRGFIRQAIASREHNAMQEYLRSFITILTEDYGFELTLPVKKAIATTAMVVDGGVDVDVTLETVNKVIKTFAKTG